MANKSKVSKVDSDKDFWVHIGRDIGETKSCGEAIRQEFHKFVTNDHAHLCTRVDKLDEKLDSLAVKLAAIVGASTVIVQIALKILIK